MDGFANFSKEVVANNGRLTLFFFLFFFLPTFLFASTFLDADSTDCEALVFLHLLWRGAPWHII